MLKMVLRYGYTNGKSVDGKQLINYLLKFEFMTRIDDLLDDINYGNIILNVFYKRITYNYL
ncbi:hypothetical protein LUA82_01105 [Neoehrlichia mikurensis]|uniref:Uncharacterized protein n=1 Tax=Neoehrlichia mikurensis TaxID=89586 RepID=A0A9Q9F5E8_9RICK|nr:hypothetical protein [Neoehrlichia mikurensis]UTO55671.1 hypothetical protein LUA82_01105 [Neoehrlichia mikurensis]